MLEGGVDAVVPVPVEVKELAARLRAIVRRSQQLRDPAHRWRDASGQIEIDARAATVCRDGVSVGLTKTELELLLVLVGGRGRVFSRQELLTQLRGAATGVDERTIYAHIHRLREKIEDDPAAPRLVQTVRGIGYRFVPPDVHP